MNMEVWRHNEKFEMVKVWSIKQGIKAQTQLRIHISSRRGRLRVWQYKEGEWNVEVCQSYLYHHIYTIRFAGDSAIPFIFHDDFGNIAQNITIPLFVQMLLKNVLLCFS